MPKYKQAVVFSKRKKYDDKDKAVNFYMHDKESGTYLDDLGYRPNPTATNINDAIINNKIYVQGKVANGQFTYIIYVSGNFIIR